jgi:predicted amidohydrolase
MPLTLRAACIQSSALPETEANVALTLPLVRRAAQEGAELIALPEYFSSWRAMGAAVDPDVFAEAEHPALAACRQEAERLERWLLLGSMAVRAPGGKILNRSYLIDAGGRIAARYDKIHLFDVDLDPSRVYRESAAIEPGSRAVVAGTPWGGIGLSICYDLRFPGLYRALAQGGASILAIPAAFTRTTGEAHWHILNRARAIENGAFVLAPCQTGDLKGGGAAYGHSLIIDPWGKVLADGGLAEGFIIADLDLEEVSRVRGRIPSLRHDRAFKLGRLARAAE